MLIRDFNKEGGQYADSNNITKNSREGGCS